MHCKSMRLTLLRAGLGTRAVRSGNVRSGRSCLHRACRRALAEPGREVGDKRRRPAAAPNVAYCRVDILFGENANQNINIRVGLPLSTLDGGSGGVQGAWNGRTQGSAGAGVLADASRLPLLSTQAM